MTQLANPVEFFGEVNVSVQPDGSLAVRSTILWEEAINFEGARIGLAIDASSSMADLYGYKMGPFPNPKPNLIEPVTREMARYLSKFSMDGKVSMIYWACQPNGALEEIGNLGEGELETFKIGGPTKHSLGRATFLLPPIKYFAESFAQAKTSFCVILTDGKFDDFEEVKTYSYQLGQEIASGRRSPIKFVILGLGPQVSEAQMAELDDLFDGSGLTWTDPENGDVSDVDLWDHKVAHQMRALVDVFAEAVNEQTVVDSSGRILNDAGIVVKEYSDRLPALIEFTLPPGSKAFTVESPNLNLTQDITEALRPA